MSVLSVIFLVIIISCSLAARNLMQMIYYYSTSGVDNEAQFNCTTSITYLLLEKRLLGTSLNPDLLKKNPCTTKDCSL